MKAKEEAGFKEERKRQRAADKVSADQNQKTPGFSGRTAEQERPARRAWPYIKKNGKREENPEVTGGPRFFIRKGGWRSRVYWRTRKQAKRSKGTLLGEMYQILSTGPEKGLKKCREGKR